MCPLITMKKPAPGRCNFNSSLATKQCGKVMILSFKTITDAVLTNVRFVFHVMTKYEQRGSVDATAASSFARLTAKLTGSGRD